MGCKLQCQRGEYSRDDVVPVIAEDEGSTLMVLPSTSDQVPVRTHYSKTFVHSTNRKEVHLSVLNASSPPVINAAGKIQEHTDGQGNNVSCPRIIKGRKGPLELPKSVDEYLALKGCPESNSKVLPAYSKSALCETIKEEAQLIVRQPHEKSNAEKLVSAAKAGDVDGIYLALEAGVSVDSRGMWNTTPLLTAAQYGHSGVALRLLQEWNADPALCNERNVTPLLYACIESDIPLVNALLQRMAPLDPDPGVVYNPLSDANMRLTPLIAACINGAYEIARTLLESGARVNRVIIIDTNFRASIPDCDEDGGVNALDCSYDHAQASIVKLLISHGAMRSQQQSQGEGYSSPFLVAMSKSSRNGRSHDEYDQGLAELVRLWPGPDTIASVLERKDKRGGNALHVACTKKYERAAIAMIEAKMSVNEKDGRGSTALHLACQKSLDCVVRALLEAGAVSQTRNLRGQTPLDIALLAPDKSTYELINAALVEISSSTCSDDVQNDPNGTF